MKLFATCTVSENNTPTSALGCFRLDGMPDVPLAIQVTTLTLGGQMKTGILMEAYANDQTFEVFAQLPQAMANCDKGLRLLMMLMPAQFYRDMLVPMVDKICKATNRPVPILIGDYPLSYGQLG